MLDYYCITEAIDNPLSQLVADLAVGLFAAAVDQRDFDFVTGLQEFCCPIQLDSQVMGANAQAKSYLFHIQRLGILAVLLLLLGALVIKLTPVDDASHRWVSIRRDFDQIKLALAGGIQSLLSAENAKLLAIIIDDP